MDAEEKKKILEVLVRVKEICRIHDNCYFCPLRCDEENTCGLSGGYFPADWNMDKMKVGDE